MKRTDIPPSSFLKRQKSLCFYYKRFCPELQGKSIRAGKHFLCKIAVCFNGVRQCVPAAKPGGIYQTCSCASAPPSKRHTQPESSHSKWVKMWRAFGAASHTVTRSPSAARALSVSAFVRVPSNRIGRHSPANTPSGGRRVNKICGVSCSRRSKSTTVYGSRRRAFRRFMGQARFLCRGGALHTGEQGDTRRKAVRRSADRQARPGSISASL